MSRKDMIESAEAALHHLRAGIASLDGLGEAGMGDALRLCREAEARLTGRLGALRAEDAARRSRFDAVPVLQAALRFRDGSTRRVAVSKPADGIGEPFVGEMFYAALVRQGVVGTLEDYPVLVVDRRRRVISTIPTATESIML